MGTHCALLVAELFLFCYERDFMMSLSANKDAEIIDAFSSTSRYLDDLLHLDNTYFDIFQMVLFLLKFMILVFLDGDIPRATSYWGL